MDIRHFILTLVFITSQYTCSAGDTLQSIAEQYCQSDNHRQVMEFREGIRELNYDLIGDGEVWEGLVLEINRWE